LLQPRFRNRLENTEFGEWVYILAFLLPVITYKDVHDENTRRMSSENTYYYYHYY
jgi:hypothetical protein